MKNSVESLLASHPVIITLPVQWGDQDALGHVNNVVYLRWLESARVEYVQRAGLAHSLSGGLGPILASLKCDFRRQLSYPDTVQVSASVTSIGRTSLRIVHLVYSTAQQAIAAEGESVLVVFDYKTQRPVPVPDEIRAKIEALEGRELRTVQNAATITSVSNSP